MVADAAVTDVAQVKLTLFSLDEANQVARELIPQLERLMKLRSELDEIETRASALSLAVAGANPGNPDALELEQLSKRRTALGREIGAGVRAIHERGALVKDLEKGLLDFYALSGDRLVFLCWQLGEPEIAHWHSLEGGFATRQPLNRTERD